MTDMMRKGAIGIGLAAMLLPLAACGSKESAEDTAAASGEEKSVEEVKREADKLIKPKPGAYKQTIEMVDMQVPGLPPEAAEQMKAMTAKVETHTICITDEDAENSFKDMFDNVGKGEECQFNRFNVVGGKLDAEMTCATPDSGQATMSMNGTVTETSSDIMVGMDMKGGEGPMANMTMKMHMTSERTGECAS